MRITDLSPFAWAKDRKDVKVVRHKDPIDLWELRRNGKFEDYQNGQGSDVFQNANYLISFIAERNSYAKFVGVWEVIGKTRSEGKSTRYRTKEIPGYETLAGRLVVEWPGARSWVQWLHGPGDKSIVELLPPNYVAEFPGFYDFTLSFDQLAAITSSPSSHREWQRMLSSVSGIYLILDERTGKQYVGSAYGLNGIWGRWSTYAKTPAGGNKLLRELLLDDQAAHQNFKFSILRVLEAGATKDEVINHEALVKRKLGSRAFGLNSN